MKPIEDSPPLDELLPLPNADAAIALPPPRTRAIALGAMSLAVFLISFDGTASDVVLPSIQQSLGADVTALQWVLNAYNLPVASLLLASGKLGDRYGRRHIFLLGLIVFTLASAICGFAPNLDVLIGGRTLQGIGAAALIPLSLTLVTATFSDLEARVKAIGFWSAVSALAMVAGPSLGGWLIDAWGWQSMFLLNLPLGVVTIGLVLWGVEVDRELPEQRLDVQGLILSIVAIAALTFALTEASKGTGLSLTVIAFVTVTVLSLLGFWIVELRTRYPIIPPTLLKNRTFTAAIGTQSLVFFTSSGMFFVLSLFLQQVQGYSAAATGLCFLPMNVAVILASLISGWMAARLGWRFPVISGLVMASVAILSLAQMDVDTPYRAILWNLILSGFGGGLTIAPLTTAAMNSVPPIHEGIASAVSNMSIQIGVILGIAVQSVILSQRLAATLRQSLAAWNLPSNLQDDIISGALQNFAAVPADLPPTIAPLLLHQEIQNAFTSGLQATLFVAGSAMLLGVGIILLLVPYGMKGRSSESSEGQ